MLNKSILGVKLNCFFGFALCMCTLLCGALPICVLDVLINNVCHVGTEVALHILYHISVTILYFQHASKLMIFRCLQIILGPMYTGHC